MGVVDRWLFDGSFADTVHRVLADYNDCCDELNDTRLQLVHSLSLSFVTEDERKTRKILHQRLRQLHNERNHLLDELLQYKVGYHDQERSNRTGGFGIAFTEN
jgi:hypothetical protein